MEQEGGQPHLPAVGNVFRVSSLSYMTSLRLITEPGLVLQERQGALGLLLSSWSGVEA